METELIELARNGDEEAFRQIYQQTSGFVYNTARRIVGRDEDAEEVTQDVFIAAHRALKSFRGDAALRTWLYRITVNRALNKVKSFKSRMRETPYEDYMDTPQETMPDRNLLEQDADARAKALLDTLTPDFRACIVLRELEGLSYEEISQSLGINVNTVRTRILRARRQLAEIVKKGGSHAL